MSSQEIVVSILGGFLAGSINTLAGNGSAITLALLTEMLSLPGNVANGTNRIGILMQGIASWVPFYRNKKFVGINYLKFIIPTCIGAVCGALVSLKISSDQFMAVYRYLMLLLLIFMFIKPDRWLQTMPQSKEVSPWITHSVLLILGFYGGFIQMGMGLFFLAVMVVIWGGSLITSNAIKIVIVSVYTLLVLILFHFHHSVRWDIGIVIGVGQALGGWLTAHYACKWRFAELWAYRFLLLIMIMTLLHLFQLDSLILSLFT
ncbi:MAG: sulfite exporter TauE/SafE family protein [Saprospiraceae bacterium]|jgi:uncharacterized membrane protein YfcA|nr:sulfite exporter TauE/SafE family protein [Saprospiraceae bacterium]MBK7796441.1 sulfite exporter TauE/SafE family protein [Saprospiraceae bacterium]MBK9378944.1 sulfite exporter TauE/SafE family protein [Saprospiraceae bacterium]MBL0260169.1 sulfite exporter TauE/SafE family protein [Saprospiraceae bacterium]MBX7164042.1 sulfite exporter TauE/SafE family protein [Saprospiraceae bacterium]